MPNVSRRASAVLLALPVCARCAGCAVRRGPKSGKGPCCHPQGAVATAAMGQLLAGAAGAPVPQRSGGHWRQSSAGRRMPLWGGGRRYTAASA
eukprot:350468-Chlamydomonas_euryale.AAC.8